MEATTQKQLSSLNSNKLAQNRPDNPLGISKEDIQRILQVKCKKHPQLIAEYLHLTVDVENARICSMCIKEEDLRLKNCQDIKEIFQKSSDKDLLCYPVLTDSKLGELIQTISNNIDSETNLMDQYFQELASMIEVVLRRRKEAQKLKLIQYGDIYQRSQVCWSEIIDIRNLRKILLDENNEEKLAQFIRNHVSNADRNTQRIKEIYDQFKGLKEEFSLKQPTEIRQLVCSLLEEIHFFMGPHPSLLHSIEQNEQYRIELQRKQQELENWQSQIRQAQETMQNQQLLQEEMKNLKEKYSLEISSLRQQNSELKNNICDKVQEISGLKQENHFLKDDNYSLKQQLKGEKESNANLREQIDYVKKSSQQINQQPIQVDHKLTRLCKKLSQERIRYSEYDENGGEGDLNTYLKGTTIRTDRDYLERKSLEMRINVERQILRVCSLPNYESVIQIDDPKKIKPATPYRFFLFGLNKKTKITITKLESVSRFDNLM